MAYEEGVGEGGRPPGLKNSGQTLFSGQAQLAQKSWMIKNISIQGKILGETLFFRASASCPKFWMIKNIYSLQWIQGKLCFSGQAQVAQKSWNIRKYFNAVKKFRANSVFQDKRKLFKILNDKKYRPIFHTVTSGHTLFFRASASCWKILNDKKYIQYSEKLHGKLCFSGKGEKIFNTIYSASKSNYRKVSCQEEHNTQETSNPWVKQGN